jgi:cation/acetate symporter
MIVPARLRTPNPHLGAYYGIVTSAFVSLIVLLAMFEQLGWGRPLLAQVMLLAPFAVYLLIAFGSRTLQPEDFFVSGRRVPAIYNGFMLSAVAVGGVGFLAYTGTVFFLGFDALAIGLGWCFGLFAASVLFVPYLRKAGSYTVPSFFGHRFRSRALRIAASLMQVPPVALLLAAEIKLAALIVSLFLPISFSVGVLMVAALIAALAILGGMRSLTWTGSAEFLVGAVGLTVVLTTVSILLTNVPAPQLTYGGMFPALQNAEITAGIAPVSPDAIAAALPGSAPLPIVKPFLQSYGVIGPFDFALLFLSLALGTAALPSLLVRSGVTSSLPEQRRSTAWALLFVALFVATAPAMAAFAKLIIFRDIALAAASSLPAWLTELPANHLLRSGDANGDGVIGAAELLIARDGVALALPAAAGLPYVLVVLMATAALAVALAAAASHLFTLAASLAEDVYRVIDRRQTLPRLVWAWAAIAASALVAAMFLVFADVDALRAALLAFAIAAATFFPALVLAIWWRRCSKWGAFAALATGFTVMLAEAIVGGAFGFGKTGLSEPLACLVGAALALAAGIAVSLYLPRPSKLEDTYCEELRDPDGETIYDRAQMRAAAAAASAAAAEATTH